GVPAPGRDRRGCLLAPHHRGRGGMARGPREHREPTGGAAIMTAVPSAAVLAALDAMGGSDARNLAWGLTAESWTRDDLLAFLAEHWAEGDPRACLEELIAANLLVQLPREWPSRYRTRMAESVRLFFRLRQLFPGQPWQSGSHLVSDFRFLRRQRAFPARTLSPDEVLAQLADRDVSANLLSPAERVLAG